MQRIAHGKGPSWQRGSCGSATVMLQDAQAEERAIEQKADVIQRFSTELKAAATRKASAKKFRRGTEGRDEKGRGQVGRDEEIGVHSEARIILRCPSPC